MNHTGTILLVEDNTDDVFFMKRALKGAEAPNPLQVVPDGAEAIDYLARNGKYSDPALFPPPCLVLLDLKMPRKNGHEVLQWIRQQPRLASLIVLVLTTSREERDIVEAYRSGANAYLLKPTTPSQLLELARSIKLFWLDHNIVS